MVRAGTADVAVRGNCPSVHAPFLELDGALMRVRLPGGVLSTAAARALAGVADSVGAGPIELTNRANLQVRGIPVGRVNEARDALVAAGLALPDGAADERRNVLSSPTAGVDRQELVDTRAVVAAVADRLASPDAVGLSPKFGIAVDGGGAVHVRGRTHDLTLGALACSDGTVRYEAHVGAALPRSHGAGDRVAMVEPDRVLDVVDAVVAACRPHGRAARFVDAKGAEHAWREINERARGALRWRIVESGADWAASAATVGVLPQHDDDRVTVGAAVVLGRLDATTLEALAGLADGFGSRELRISPWRSVMFVDVPISDADRVMDACDTMGLTCDPLDPSTAVVACAGSAGCAQARADVQGDARRLITRLGTLRPDDRVGSVHVSGCEKGCARAQPAEISLVARDNGTYDLYAASARDPRARHPRFGRQVHCGLEPDAAIDVVVASKFA